MKRVAVILSGCGVFDGSEIHEAVLTLHAIEKSGATWHCFAPDIEQSHTINHLSGDVDEHKRNVLQESARVCRGNIQDVSKLHSEEFDALVLPGGFGAAKNLTDFALKGAECSINAHVASACRSFCRAGKPAAYMCIAPIIIPMIYPKGTKGTIGNDSDTAQAFETMGGAHISCPVDDYVYDQEHKVLSTPAYMIADNISQAASGIEAMIKKLVELA
ncbi:isoprenoid biosynthesis glyoxalase ElbB [Vibrio sonorensis]|uniref:isoprenoid biosynthesis glyoxalase ElbB n=1 Tax=Vibrio sonorensis TaxID=1004316 RepID=UPI0008DB1679|nr:isoprenoid biosynthesis glyoxalase ElbB [Vibrio sonorensis]